jgi:hypothetical protein
MVYDCTYMVLKSKGLVHCRMMYTLLDASASRSCSLYIAIKVVRGGDLMEVFLVLLCALQILLEYVLCILLGPPGCAQVSPYLSPGLLVFFGGMKTANKPHASRNYTQDH